MNRSHLSANASKSVYSPLNNIQNRLTIRQVVFIASKRIAMYRYRRTCDVIGTGFFRVILGYWPVFTESAQPIYVFKSAIELDVSRLSCNETLLSIRSPDEFVDFEQRNKLSTTQFRWSLDRSIVTDYTDWEITARVWCKLWLLLRWLRKRRVRLTLIVNVRKCSTNPERNRTFTYGLQQNKNRIWDHRISIMKFILPWSMTVAYGLHV